MLKRNQESQDNKVLNQYGDKDRQLSPGFGVDIATQRADDLDLRALDFIQPKMTALDLGCGQGGQSLRMAQKGARVMGVDTFDFTSDIIKLNLLLPEENTIRFIQSDIRTLSLSNEEMWDLIVCQRTLHYLKYSEAKKVLSQAKRWLKPDGRMFLSVSGLHSELGHGYSGWFKQLDQRYIPLDKAMQEKHHILGPVCLYTRDDFIQLAEESGLSVIEAFTSPFGNVKMVCSL